MKLEQLQHLMAIVEHGSLRSAAKRLDMPQPALTRSVRALEREVAKICRKMVKRIALEEDTVASEVTPDMLPDLLGVRKFNFGIAEEQNKVGQVTGLAWTSVGGELLTIEAASVAGKGRYVKTGSLGVKLSMN